MRTRLCPRACAARVLGARAHRAELESSMAAVAEDRSWQDRHYAAAAEKEWARRTATWDAAAAGRAAQAQEVADVRRGQVLERERRLKAEAAADAAQARVWRGEVGAAAAQAQVARDEARRRATERSAEARAQLEDQAHARAAAKQVRVCSPERQACVAESAAQLVEPVRSISMLARGNTQLLRHHRRPRPPPYQPSTGGRGRRHGAPDCRGGDNSAVRRAAIKPRRRAREACTATHGPLVVIVRRAAPEASAPYTRRRRVTEARAIP